MSNSRPGEEEPPRRVLVVNRHRALGDLLFVRAVLERMRREWPCAAIAMVQAASEAVQAVSLHRLTDALWLTDEVQWPDRRRLEDWLEGERLDLAWLVLVDGPADQAWIELAATRSARLMMYVPSPREGRRLERRGRCRVRVSLSGTTAHRRDQLMASVFEEDERPAGPLSLPIEPQMAAEAAELRRSILERSGARGLALVVLGVGPWLPQRRLPRRLWLAAAEEARRQGLAVAIDAWGEGAGMPGAISLPYLPLPLLLALVAASDLVISGDTGPAHAAVTLGVNNVTLFGPTGPAMHGHRRGDRGVDVAPAPCPFGIERSEDPAACARHCAAGEARCFAPAVDAARAVGAALGSVP